MNIVQGNANPYNYADAIESVRSTSKAPETLKEKKIPEFLYKSSPKPVLENPPKGKTKPEINPRMFFFFAGGLTQQVSQVLKSGAGRCINCGSRADLVEYEKVLKLFFVPVYKWPGREPMMYCNNCSLFFPPELSSLPRDHTTTSSGSSLTARCRSCDQVVDAEFKYCPFCGTMQ